MGKLGVDLLVTGSTANEFLSKSLLRVQKPARRVGLAFAGGAFLCFLYLTGSRASAPVPTSSVLPPSIIEFVDADGRDVGLDLKGRENPLVLFVLAVDCSYCDANLKNWVELVQSERSIEARTEYVVVSRSSPDETKEYLADTGLESLSVAWGEPLQLRALSVGGTPSTVLVGRRGSEVLTWLGVLPRSAMHDILNRLGK
jgi:hypothetical protein